MKRLYRYHSRRASTRFRRPAMRPSEGSTVKRIQSYRVSAPEALLYATNERTLKERDESATRRCGRKVARLLRLQGFEVSPAMGAVAGKGEAEDRPGRGKRGRRKPIPIELHEPPTFVRLVWTAEEPIMLYPSQRRYIRSKPMPTAAITIRQHRKNHISTLSSPAPAYVSAAPPRFRAAGCASWSIVVIPANPVIPES